MTLNEAQAAQIQSILDAPTQYPEVDRKPRDVREADLLDWLEKYGEVNACYNLYGMDRADAQPCDDWLDLKAFSKLRWDVNSTFSPLGKTLKYDHTLIPRSKLLSEMYLHYWFGEDSGAYIPTKGILVHNDFFRVSPSTAQRVQPCAFADFIGEHDKGQKLVFKEVYGGRGRQIVIAEIVDGGLRSDGKTEDLESFIQSIASPISTWIVQDYFVQHADMARFNPTSLNTLRVVTYHVGTHAFVDDAAVRMGCPGAVVDNAYADGFYTNVDEEGRLDPSLFNFSHKSRTIHDFQDAVIPNMAAIRDLCKQAHEALPQLFTIGWDIAIGEDGKPTIVEFNDGWAVFVTQTAIGHAGRPHWNTYLAERQAYIAAAHQA